jgi:predicted amidohydrolase YtcJ
VIRQLANDGQLTIRMAYNLFTQKPKQEKDAFLNSAPATASLLGAMMTGAACAFDPAPFRQSGFIR